MKRNIPWIRRMSAFLMAAVWTAGMGGAAYAGETEEEPMVVTIQPMSGEAVPVSEEDAEVLKANSVTIGNRMSGVVDVASLVSVSAEEIKGKIDSYYIPDSCIYLDGELRMEGDLDAVINRRNVSAIRDPVTIRYGVMTDNTAVRAYPSWQKLSETDSENAADYFQESVFLIGEGVAVLHQTEDQVWSFVQGINDVGWVETENIAFCTREDMNAFANAASFAVVTEDILMVGDREFRMGTRLPMSRVEGTSAIVYLPQANDNGNLYQTELRLSMSGGIHIGYMNLTSANLVWQANKLIDAGYSQGDGERMWDDMSAMASVYRCCGVLLPRDSSRLIYAGLSAVDMNGMDPAEKRNLIAKQEPGCLLVMEDHVVMYLGTDRNGNMTILHCVDQYSVDGVNVIDASRCVVTPVDVYTEDGRNYLECYQYLISF